MKYFTSFVTWDYKEQPDWEVINKHLQEATQYSHPVVYSPKIVEISDTGSDQLGIAITTDPNMTEEEATELYENELIEFDLREERPNSKLTNANLCSNSTFSQIKFD
jgi:hypothetical protein